MQSVEIGLAAPSRDGQHLARLVALRLDRVAEALDAEFGFDAAAVHVLIAEPLADRQTRLAMTEAIMLEACLRHDPPEALAQLIDRLQQRLGSGAVSQLHPHQSHIPERAVRARPPSPRATPTSPHTPIARGRPAPAKAGVGVRGSDTLRHRCKILPLTLTLSPQAGRGNPVAARCDGLPTLRPHYVPSFCCPARSLRRSWPSSRKGRRGSSAGAACATRCRPRRGRSASHRNGGAESGEAERDYYVVEDSVGRRFWLYRAGLYGRGEPAPQWFVHGVFG